MGDDNKMQNLEISWEKNNFFRANQPEHMKKNSGDDGK